MQKVYIIFEKDDLEKYPVGLKFNYNESLEFVNKIKERNRTYYIYEYEKDENDYLYFKNVYIIVNEYIEKFNYENV